MWDQSFYMATSCRHCDGVIPENIHIISSSPYHGKLFGLDTPPPPPKKNKNKGVVQMAEINDISCKVRRRRWNWLEHVLRREGVNDCFTALGWTPEGRRARTRPKPTWRRTVEKKRNMAGWKSWNVAKAAGGWQQRMLGGQCFGLMHLLAQWAMMMMIPPSTSDNNIIPVYLHAWL